MAKRKRAGKKSIIQKYMDWWKTNEKEYLKEANRSKRDKILISYEKLETLFDYLEDHKSQLQDLEKVRNVLHGIEFYPSEDWF